MKMVDLGKHPDARNTVRKETTIHRMLSNPYIIQYFGQRSESNIEYIFLEYASGGELFDRIEPDVGMPIEEARKYFRQLIIAVEYLHSRGVAHRDLKPENLLLDANDNLKVSDFGLATVYRLHGKERYLNKKCGTLPYVAPEVLERPYHAEPADIWSCGIILIALLAGELPWDQASKNCSEYSAWKNNSYHYLTPWKKLDRLSLLLLKKILVHVPSVRSSLYDIKKHDWYNTGFYTDVESCNKPALENTQLNNIKEQAFCFSQPELPPVGISLTNMKFEERTGLSFSQPASVENLLVSSQLQAINTQASQNTFQNLVRRMTRCFASTSCEDTVKIITQCLVKKNYHYRVNNFGIITISTVDKRKMPLVFKINIIDMDNKTLIDFRLSKGCGIEFKKEFVKIKTLLNHILLTSNNI
ncbi:PREDICTED: serine/threonine-protein kinase grp isoform X2 [Ceratosolen solmsi marchali]|nr:PREDICTED: serine/threonine-protein kinase grp isoform X2 [Ceratosolen solmsi marchali]